MIIIMLSFRFWIFVFSYLLSFLLFSILVQPGSFLSVNLIHIHICRPKQTKSSVGRKKEKWIQGYEWRMVSLVTHHECSEVGSHSPALLCAHNLQVFHEHGRYFGQWNLTRGDMSLPNWSIIFYSTSWNADVMTAPGAAMLHQK